MNYGIAKCGAASLLLLWYEVAALADVWPGWPKNPGRAALTTEKIKRPKPKTMPNFDSVGMS
jgi:hypothetical protein